MASGAALRGARRRDRDRGLRRRRAGRLGREPRRRPRRARSPRSSSRSPPRPPTRRRPPRRRTRAPFRAAGPAGSVRQGGPGRRRRAAAGSRRRAAPAGAVRRASPAVSLRPAAPGSVGRRRRGRRSAACSTPGTPSKALVAVLLGERLVLPLGRRDRRREQRRGRPARARQARDGDRRLQRHRSVTDARRSSRLYVAAGKIHYFVASGGGGGGPGAGSSASSSAIASWVEQNFTSTTVGGVTVYDLSA